MDSPRTPRLRSPYALAITATALIIFAASATAAPSGLATRQQQVAALEAQVGALEERYDGLQERYRGARVEQRELDRASRRATQQLRRTRERLAAARVRLTNRAIAIYQDSSSSPLLELAAAGSIADAFARVEAASQIGKSDAAHVETVMDLERRLDEHERDARAARDAQARVTRRMARDAKQMRGLLDERRSTLASATAEVRAQMQRERRVAAASSTVVSQERVAQLSDGSAQTPAAASDGASSPNDTESSSSATSGGQTSGNGMSVPLPPSSSSAAQAAQIAMGKIGAPYVWAAAGPNSFDCSGLVVWAFAQAGRSGLPHSTYSLITMGVEVPLSQVQAGDLVFTNNTGHMGIYVGGGQMVHAPRTGRTVSVEPLTYYSVTSVRRI